MKMLHRHQSQQDAVSLSVYLEHLRDLRRESQFRAAPSATRSRNRRGRPSSRLCSLVVLLLIAASPQRGQETGAAHYQKGASHFQSGQIAEAIKEFETATRLAPSDPRPWKGLGVAHASQGHFNQALEPFRKACELEPRDTDSCYYLGNVSHGLGHYETAIGAYQQVLKTAPRDARAHGGLGVSLEAVGQYKEAESALRQAAEYGAGKSISNLDPRVELGAFLFRQGRLAEAVPALEEAVKARPDSPRAHFELARAQVQMDRLDEATSHLKEALRLDPNYAAAHLLLGKVHFREGRTREGERETLVGRTLSGAADQARVGSQQAPRSAPPDSDSGRQQRP